MAGRNDHSAAKAFEIQPGPDGSFTVKDQYTCELILSEGARLAEETRRQLLYPTPRKTQTPN